MAGASGALFWQRARMQRLLTAGDFTFDEDGEIALHIARHEANTRQHPLAALHLLYGLLQNDEITAAIRGLGGDPDAIEDRLLGALDSAPPRDERACWEELRIAIGWALHLGNQGKRKAGVADLWGGIMHIGAETTRIVEAKEAGGVRVADVLARLIHGDVSPAPERGAVRVVLVNDDITPQELVIDILQRVFELNQNAATERMLEAHHEGSGTVAQFPAREARAKVDAAHDLARKRGSPLLFRLEAVIPI